MVEVPRWSLEGGTATFLQRAADPELPPRIGQEMTQYMDTKYYNETTGAQGLGHPQPAASEVFQASWVRARAAATRGPAPA